LLGKLIILTQDTFLGISVQQLSESEEIGEALLFLAKYEMDRFRYREATEYAKIAADFPYPVSAMDPKLVQMMRLTFN